MLSVRVVGGLALTVDDEAVEPPTGRPARALLGWLATHPGRHGRGRVAAALWPDFRDESARANLRTALSAVRETLGTAGGTGLVADRQIVGLADPPEVVVDVNEFEALLEAGRPVEAIAALGGGEVLPDLDYDWVFHERDRVRELVSSAMAGLAAAAEARGDQADAVAWLRRRTASDPFDESAHRDLIAAMVRAGDRAGALIVYERLSERLRRELGVAPSAATRGLATSLRKDELDRLGIGDQRLVARADFPRRLDPARWRGEFVGRADAFARLHAAWAAVQDGGVAFAVVVGEAGIGKSRLSARFAEEVYAAGATVLAGVAEEDGVRPYGPIFDALEGELGSSVTPVAISAVLDDTDARIRLQATLADALERAARGRPLLLILDDLHWSDPETLAFLRHLGHRGLTVPGLLLITARLGYVGGVTPLACTLSAIAREVRLGRVALEGLAMSETAALVASREQHIRLGSGELQNLQSRTGGNPFFLEALLDAGFTWAGTHIPADVAELVVSRVDALGPSVQRTLEAAAILGREFDPVLVAVVARIDADAAIAALDLAAVAHLVSPTATASGQMAFVHALVQEALTSRLTPGRRTALHAGAVEALEPRVRNSPDVLAAAAGHALAAVPAISVAHAADLANQAAIELMSNHAPAEAADLLRRALAACDPAGAPLEIRVRLRLSLGEALQASDRKEEATAVLEAALSQARRLHNGVLLARAVLGVVGPGVTIVAVDPARVAILEEGLDALRPGDTELGARLKARLAFELAYDKDPHRRHELSTAALSGARTSGDTRTLAAALSARHVVLWGPDHTRERLELASEMLALALRAEDPGLELQARTWRLVDLEELGDGQAVDAELEAYASTAARTPLSAFAWYVPAWRAARAFLKGHVDEARELQRQAAKMGRRARDPNVQFVERLQFIVALADERPEDIDVLWQGERVRNSPAGWAYRALKVWALAAAGEPGEARRDVAVQRAAGVPRSWPRDTNWLSATKELSEAAYLLGDLELGADLEDLLAPFADRLVVSARALLCIGSVAGALGRLAELRGDLDAAIDHYEQAIEREESAGALIWATNHRRRLADVYAAAGRTDQRDTLLSVVKDQASAMGLMRLAQLADRAGPAPTGSC
jgi:DNA-binding SARP family transcriptional activator/tetratricopeptide (TPR) repeat protein